MRKIIALFVLFGLLGMVFAADLDSKLEINVKEIKPVINMQPMNCDPANNGPFKFMVKLRFNNDYEENVDVYYSAYDMRTGTWVDKGLLLVVGGEDSEEKQVQFDFYAGGQGNGTIETPAFQLWYEDPEHQGLTIRKNITIETQHWETTNEMMVKKKIAEIQELVSQIEEKGCDATEIKNNITQMQELMAICECSNASIIGTKAKTNAEQLLESCTPTAPEEGEQEINITPAQEEEQPPVEEEQPPVQEQPAEEEETGTQEQGQEQEQQPGLCSTAFILATLGVLVARWEY